MINFDIILIQNKMYDNYLHKTLFGYLLLFLMSVPICLSIGWVDNVLYDLQVPSDFNPATERWETTYEDEHMYSTCGTVNLLDGYFDNQYDHYIGNYLEKTYSGLPPHNYVFMNVSIYLIDDWTRGTVQISFDNQTITLPSITMTLEKAKSQKCGNTRTSELDLDPFILESQVAHSGSNLTLRFYQEPTYGYIGYRDLALKFANSTDIVLKKYCLHNLTSPNCQCIKSLSLVPSISPYLSNTCVVCPKGALYSLGRCYYCHANCTDCIPGVMNKCSSCSNDKVLLGGLCLECHSSCKTCNGTSQNNCLSCKSDKEFLSNGQCMNCDSSCKTCNGGNQNNCLSCSLGTFLSMGECKSCHPYCLSCDGEKSSDCLACLSPLSLKAGRCIPSVIECFSNDGIGPSCSGDLDCPSACGYCVCGSCVSNPSINKHCTSQIAVVESAIVIVLLSVLGLIMFFWLLRAILFDLSLSRNLRKTKKPPVKNTFRLRLTSPKSNKKKAVKSWWKTGCCSKFVAIILAIKDSQWTELFLAMLAFLDPITDILSINSYINNYIWLWIPTLIFMILSTLCRAATLGNNFWRALFQYDLFFATFQIPRTKNEKEKERLQKILMLEAMIEALPCFCFAIYYQVIYRRIEPLFFISSLISLKSIAGHAGHESLKYVDVKDKDSIKIPLLFLTMIEISHKAILTILFLDIVPFWGILTQCLIMIIYCFKSANPANSSEFVTFFWGLFCTPILGCMDIKFNKIADDQLGEVLCKVKNMIIHFAITLFVQLFQIILIFEYFVDETSKNKPIFFTYGVVCAPFFWFIALFNICCVRAKFMHQKKIIYVN